MKTLITALFAAALTFAAPATAQEWSAPLDPVVLTEAQAPQDGWITVRGTWLAVHGDPSIEPLLLEIARHGSEALPRLADRLGVPEGETVHVYVADSTAEFHAIQPGRVPEYADGTAWPERSSIFLRRPGARGAEATPLLTVLEHELVHVLVGRALAPNHPPTWLQEGLAKVLAGEHDPRAAETLAAGMATTGLLSLDEITRGFPRDPRRAQLAYAQSADFIAWLIANHGEGAIHVLLREMAQDGDEARAIRRATGMFLEDADRAWRATYDTDVPFGLASLGSEETWWGILGVVAAGSLVAARRRARERLAKYAKDEAERDAWLAHLETQLAERLRWHDPIQPFPQHTTG